MDKEYVYSLKATNEHNAKLMQKYLPCLRTLAGLSRTELSCYLGCCRQVIQYYEKVKHPLTVPNYLALRYIFEKEFEHENETLAKLIEFLFADYKSSPDDWQLELLDSHISRAEDDNSTSLKDEIETFLSMV